MKKIIFLLVFFSFLFSFQNKYNFNGYSLKEQKYLYYQTLYKIEKLKIRLIKNALRFKYLNENSVIFVYLENYLTRNYIKFVNDLNYISSIKMNLPVNIRYRLAERIKRYNYYLRVRNYYAYGVHNIDDYTYSNEKNGYFVSFYKKIISDIILINRVEIKILDNIKKSKLYNDNDIKHRFFRLNIYYGEPFSTYSFYNFLKYMNRAGATLIN